jgi:hypothetical protein|tara:strand:+ start:39 stop:230 length:192 start_codon:yes stop_codon:yes gene_type:complete
MKEKEINLQIENITSKQWTNLVIELNLIAKAWKPYGPIIKLKTKNLERILKWGRKKPGDPESD